MRGIGWLALLWLAGCGHRVALAPSLPATAAFVSAPSWHTLSAEHRVTITVPLERGRTDTRSLRGLIAVLRPDQFRLRALGPAGLTLFDLLVKDGKPTVVSAIRSPSDGASGQTLADVITSLAADLACAYALAPSAERTLRLEGDTVVVEEPGRKVRLSRFSGDKPTWHRAEIEAARYRVTVEVSRVELDPVIDSAMWDP